jgi:uncharacterized coiled-coil protein SlyX
MDGSQFPALAPVGKRIVPYVVALVVGGAGVGYAVHEHNSAQSLAAQNQQVTAQLNATHSQLDALTAKVNALALSNQPAPSEAKPTPATHAPSAVTSRRPAAHRDRAADQRFKKMQAQLDAQGKAIDDTRSDLTNTRTELTGSIARTHDELVVLQKRGERNYIEFDLTKSKDFKREGPISVSLRKANTKRGYADLALMVDDRNLSQKHVNLYQPAMFYEPDSPQPVEIVINDISKNHIHGYVSAPKYRQSELAAMFNPDQAGNPTAQAPVRQKLPLPSANADEQ